MPVDMRPFDPAALINPAALAVSGDGSQVAVVHGDALVVFDASKGSVERASEAAPQAATSAGLLAWSPKSALLARVSDGSHIELVDANQFTTQRVLDGHESATAVPPVPSITALAWSPDGATLASAGRDGVVKLWSVSAGNVLREITPAGVATWLSFGPDGSRLISANLNDPPQIWEASSGAALGELGGVSFGAQPVWSPDGATIALCDQKGALLLFDGHSLAHLSTHELGVRPLYAVWTGDGSRIAMVTEDRTTVGVWVPGDEDASTLTREGHDPTRIYPVGGGSGFVSADDAGIVSWDAISGESRAFETLTWG